MPTEYQNIGARNNTIIRIRFKRKHTRCLDAGHAFLIRGGLFITIITINNLP